MSKWKVGDRVTRMLFMDDGTWHKNGDECLKHSPLKHGQVIITDANVSRDAVIVRFDDGSVGMYLDHGIEREVEHV